MLTCRPGTSEGFSLIELMVALAVIAVVLALGLPNVSVWIQNTQLKTAAEGVVSGLQMARAEALRRNVNVRFQLVTTMDSGCKVPDAEVVTGANWVVSLADPSGKCDLAPSDDTTTPQIVQKKSGADGSVNATLAAAGSGLLVYNGLGRPATVPGVTNLTHINIRNPAGGGCQPPNGKGEMRCLSVMVGNGGQVRMCDPAVADVNDSRSCGTGFEFKP
jgi:type IV fimbrial biogenesis protein FimT